MRQTFTKKERLSSKKIIAELFKKGSAFYLYPFRIIYLSREKPSTDLPQVLFTVSKRNFKTAVSRNWIKRRLREIYRKNKHKLTNKEGNFTIDYLGIIYIAKEKIPYQKQKEKILKLFERFSE